MLERFSNLYKSANRVLADHMRHDLQLNRTDLDLIFTAVEALRPFEEATREMSGENDSKGDPYDPWPERADVNQVEEKDLPNGQRTSNTDLTKI